MDPLTSAVTPPQTHSITRPDIPDGSALILLTQNKLALVDEALLAGLSAFAWFSVEQRTGNFYAGRTATIDGQKLTVWLHHQVLQVPNDLVVDHINGDGLDCRLRNLRPATGQQNAWNQRKRVGKAGYKGVVHHRGRWEARILHEGKLLQLGSFSGEIEAAKAYDAAARRLRGPFARVNFP